MVQKQVEFDFSNIGFGAKKLILASKPLIPYVEELENAIAQKDKSHPAASLLLPFEHHGSSEAILLAKKIPKPSLIIVVGIGGSNLGTMAVHQALFGRLHNLESNFPQILFADTTDPRSIESIISIARKHVERSNHIVLNVISKSGKTVETIANFDVLYSALSSFESGFMHTVITCDENSAFESIAKREGFQTLSIPPAVGGRYSVFSNVGIFPLALCGADIPSLLEGARQSCQSCLSSNISKNPAALMASSLYLHQKAGRNIHVNFLFSNSLHSMGLWYRQLMGESIGKEKNLKGKKINSGITPTVAIGTTDLHSMAQLYLGGPDDKTYRFASVGQMEEDFQISSSPLISKLAPELKGEKLSGIMNGICSGVKIAFKNKKRPFASVGIPALDEHCIGQLMQEEMIEMMLLAKLMNVNAFDQPAVENYKTEARKIISKS